MPAEDLSLEGGMEMAAAAAPRLQIAVIGIRGLPPNYGGLETCAEEVCTRWARAGQ